MEFALAIHHYFKKFEIVFDKLLKLNHSTI
jgi:hypothetical protein